jgi:uncharacterized membrane protein (UPF0127 family)
VRLDSMEEQELAGGLRLAVARSHRQRGVGLMGLAELPPGRALRIPRCSSVHTFWMRFPIDLVWLDGDGRVLRTDEGVRRRVSWCRGAREVVETRAGEGAAYAAALSPGSAASGSSSAAG